MEIKPIRNEADYESALKEIDELFNAQPGTPDADRLEVLLILVEDYEEKHYTIPLPDPIEAIEYHLERLHWTRKDLEPLIGSRTRVWEIMNRKRSLTLSMIRRISKALGIPADILAQEYELNIKPAQDRTAEIVNIYTGLVHPMMDLLSGPPDPEFPSHFNAQLLEPRMPVKYFIVDDAGNPCPVGPLLPVMAIWENSDCFNPNPIKTTQDLSFERVLQ